MLGTGTGRNYVGVGVVTSGLSSGALNGIRFRSLSSRSQIPLAGGPNALRREEDVDAASGTEIEHGLSRLQLDQGRWIATAQRHRNSLSGKATGLGVGVEIGRDWITASTRARTATPTGFANRTSNLAVLLADRILNLAWEARVMFGPGYRIYFAKDGAQLVLLLLGGDKSTQTADVARAQESWQAYQEDKRRGKTK